MADGRPSAPPAARPCVNVATAPRLAGGVCRGQWAPYVDAQPTRTLCAARISRPHLHTISQAMNKD
eukprot:366506-Chlamydomonas_euryale.AAC.11